jgi:hypothetical protein
MYNVLAMTLSTLRIYASSIFSKVLIVVGLRTYVRRAEHGCVDVSVSFVLYDTMIKKTLVK